MNNKKLLGKRIKVLRKQANYTQEQLSEIINIDITTLSGIESGRHFPSLPTIEKIADTLKVDLQALFNFNHFKTIEDMKSEITTNLDNLTSDDIKFIHKFIDQKYLQSE